MARNFETAFEWFAKAAVQTQPQSKGARDTETERQRAATRQVAVRNLQQTLTNLVFSRGKVHCHDIRFMSHTMALC